jgi:general secretion pathway protein C
VTKSQQRMLNLLLLIAIAASATYWVIQFASPPRTQERLVAVPTTDRSARTQTMDIAPIAGMFGSSAVSTTATNITVVGVIAPGGENEGVALLSVDDLPAMAFRVGDLIGGTHALQRVTSNGVIIEQGGIIREVLLPARQPPTGISPAE